MLDTEHIPLPREPVALVPDQDLSPARPSDERLEDLRTRSLAAAQQGNYLEAIRYLEELVARTEATSGSNDLHTLSARTDLAFSSALPPTPRAEPAEATPVFGSHGYGPPAQSSTPTLRVGGGLHPAEEATPSKRKRFWFFRR